MIRHLCNLLLSLFPPSRLFKFRNFLLRISGVDIHDSASFCGRSWIYGRGKLHIGAETWLSPGSIIHTHIDADISIGERCDIGPGVEFITGSHLIGTALRRAGRGTAFPILVGNGCWIGANVTLLGGVVIGEGCIVAAGAVVTHDIPPHTLVAGIPAQVKRQLLQ